MVRGLPDYTRLERRYIPYTIILEDDFEDTLLKWPVGGSPGYEVVRVTDMAYYGGACLKLKTGTVANYQANVMHTFAMAPEQKLTLQILWYYPRFDPEVWNNEKKWKLEVDVLFEKVLKGYYPGVMYLVDDGKWQYRDENNTWVDIPGGTQYLAYDTWHRLTLMVDLKSEKYIKLESDLEVFDLRELNMYTYSLAATAPTQSWIEIFMWTLEALSKVVYIDGVKLFTEIW